MTDISESGIEAAARVHDNWTGRETTIGSRNALRNTRQIVEAYLPFHPPASREEGLREAAEVTERYVIEEQPGDVKTVLARKMAASILALIPTKPEAKEPAEDLLRDIRDHIDDPEYIKLLRPEIEAALQSKKPE